MLDDPIHSNTALRYMIRDAVERECASQIGSLNQQVQILLGQVRQYNLDLGGLQQRIASFNILLHGDRDTGTIGMVQTINDFRATIDTLRAELEDLRKDREIASIQRETLLKVARWTRYAVIAVATLVGVADVPRIADLLKVLRLVP
jgi:hypothetical protein